MKNYVKYILRLIIKIITKSEYRSYAWWNIKYFNYPRYKQTRIRYGKYKIIVPDIVSFLYMFKTIFINNQYCFVSDKNCPVIIDCGANIGISLLYFKILYPKSKVIAFEADPKVFYTLEQNVKNNKLENVELINKALWKEETSIIFNSEGADSGRIEESENASGLSVNTVKLSKYLKNEVIDLLKMDIEGAEYDVFKESLEFLTNAKNIFIEYHSFKYKDQRLGELLSYFESMEYRYHLLPESYISSPFKNYYADLREMDMQINLYIMKKCLQKY